MPSTVRSALDGSDPGTDGPAVSDVSLSLGATLDDDVGNARRMMLAAQEAVPMGEQLRDLHAGNATVAEGYAGYRTRPLGVYDNATLAAVIASEPEASREFEVHRELEGDPCADDTELFTKFLQGGILLMRECLGDLLAMFPLFAQTEHYERIVIERDEVESFGLMSDQYYRHTIDRVVVDKATYAQSIPIDGGEDERAEKLHRHLDLYYVADVKRRLLHLDVTQREAAGMPTDEAVQKLIDQVEAAASMLHTIVSIAAELREDQERRLQLLDKHQHLEECRLRVAEEQLDQDTSAVASAELAELATERAHTEELLKEYRKYQSEPILYFQRKILSCVAGVWAPPDGYQEKAAAEGHDRHMIRCAEIEQGRDVQAARVRQERNFEVPANPALGFD